MNARHFPQLFPVSRFPVSYRSAIDHCLDTDFALAQSMVISSRAFHFRSLDMPGEKRWARSSNRERILVLDPSSAQPDTRGL